MDIKKQIEESSKSIDKFGRLLMQKYGTKPVGQRHFNEEGLSEAQKSSIRRLLDLKIVTFESLPTDYGFEYAYHWTEFGDEIMRCLGILVTSSNNQKRVGGSITINHFLTILGVIIALLALIWSIYTYTHPILSPDQLSQPFSTSTIKISDLLSKALKLETIIERQDFLTKYINSQILGTGIIEQISRSGGNSGFLVDIKADGRIITCFQEKTDENEKQLPLLQGKKINFTGIFTYQEVSGHGLDIRDCVLY